ncbi:MAG TPA: hypothetical protein VGU63_08675 [Candidatus Acidoferrales bacterium]|nr:hypothetical protein [Candidatus Acidoferrales bacterium]
MKAGMPSVSVREWVNNANQFVMKANCYLVCREGLVIHPITNVSKECGDSISDFMHEDSDVFLGMAIRTSPFPGAIKHSSVKFTKIRLGKWIAGLYASGI